jgi:hypothetical protein
MLVFAFFSGVAKANSDALVDMLTQQLGVTQAQAEGGLGALLSTAQDNMSSSDFDQLGDVIPNMSGLLGAAPQLPPEEEVKEEKSSLMSMAGGLLGESGDQLQYLDGAFKSLGLDSKTIAQYSKLLLDYVESEGGQEMMKTLQAALLGG